MIVIFLGNGLVLAVACRRMSKVGENRQPDCGLLG